MILMTLKKNSYYYKKKNNNNLLTIHQKNTIKNKIAYNLYHKIFILSKYSQLKI